MDEPSQAPAQTRWKLAARIGWAALIVATLYVCYFSHLGTLGFIGPDEPRYAWVAREMVESHDWVTPRLYGKPWFEKPVLYYWGAALCFELFGVNEAAARLPSALSALLATLSLAWLAWRVYGGETARWLLVLLPTTVGMIGFSHAATMDMPFTGMLTVALVAAAVVLGFARPAAESPSSPDQTATVKGLLATPWSALIAFGVFLGAAVLAKGPAAIVLCGGAVLLWALFTRGWRDAFRLLHPVAIAAFCVTALPWYILCARRNPDFFRVFIIEHNFQRYLTPEFRHIQPFWFYVPILIVAASPWVPLVFARARVRFEEHLRNKPARPVAKFLWSWVLFVTLFFSLSKSKLPGYILPAVPSVIMGVALSLARALQSERFSRWIAVGSGVSLMMLGTVWAFVDSQVPGGQDIVPAPWQRQMTFVFSIGGLIVVTLAAFKRSRSAMFATLLTFLSLTANGESALVRLDPVFSSRHAVQDALFWSREGFVIERACAYKLPRGPRYGLSFYLHREVRECASTEPLGSVFTTAQEVADLKQQGVLCPPYIVFPAAIPCAARKSQN